MIKIFKYIKWEKIIKKSGLFDAKYYLFTYPDVRQNGVNPIKHYIKFGVKEGRNPSANFDTNFYLNANDDVKISGVNPLVHYILFGKQENREIWPSEKINLSVEKINSQSYQTKDKLNKTQETPNKTKITEYTYEEKIILESGLFDISYYLDLYKDIEKNNQDPIKHFCKSGWKEGKNPSADFDTNFYLNANYDVKYSGMNPLSHYIEFGKAEGRLKDINGYQEKLVGTIFKPKISIIVPNYNHAKYLNKRIDSILDQTYENYEILLLDDCSTDDSRVILEEYANQHPNKIKLLFNEKNAGNVFRQWRKGVENSSGELIWLCESDDYCEHDFLEKLVEQFKNSGVNIAFGKIQFCDENSNFQSGLDIYREGAESAIWNTTLVRPAHQWFCNAFGVNNVIANVGGCIFKKQNIDSKVWEEAQRYKILGDWFLYSHIANGGLIAYEPTAVAYFRQHGLNTSVSSFSTAKYYEEHFSLMKTLKTMWNIPNQTIDKFYSKIEFQYKHFKCEKALGKLENYIDVKRLKDITTSKKHILIGIYAFHPGGGELFPINLANALQKEGNIVSLFIFDTNDINQDIYNLVDRRIAMYDSKFLEVYGVDNFLKNAGISVINSHMVTVDMFFLVGRTVNMPYFPTLHGSYEACKSSNDIIEKISKGVTHWIYTTDRNLRALQFLDIPENKFTKLPNAMPIDDEPFPKSREELGIKEDTVVFTLVARGIKRKGWRAAINAFLEVEKKYANVHLLLCGDGEETQKYKKIYNDNPKITFLGYQSKIHGLYRVSDCAIVPTRFEGESFPLCIIQALQVGLPVIGTDVGEIKSMLTTDSGEIAGVILPNERDTEAFTGYLADAMLKMVQQERRETFSKLSKELAKKYSISNLAKRYMELFKEKRKTICFQKK